MITHITNSLESVVAPRLAVAKEESVLRACRVILRWGVVSTGAIHDRRAVVQCDLPGSTIRRGSEGPSCTKFSAKSSCDHETYKADTKLKNARVV